MSKKIEAFIERHFVGLFGILMFIFNIRLVAN
jgi:hypothetical protein